MFLLQVPRGNWVVLKFLTAENNARLTALILGFQEQAGCQAMMVRYKGSLANSPRTQEMQKYRGRTAEMKWSELTNAFYPCGQFFLL